jgi:hypothetical protein
MNKGRMETVGEQYDYHKAAGNYICYKWTILKLKGSS